MSRQKITPGRKVAEAVADGLNRKDFSAYECAENLLKTSNPDDVLKFAAAIIDVAAIHWDHGIFDEHYRETHRVAGRMRDCYYHETS